MKADQAKQGGSDSSCHIGDTRVSFKPPLTPCTDNAFALVLPEASTNAMQVYLDKFSKTIASDEHVVMAMDQAGWHGSHALKVPTNITLKMLPARSPQLNPVERLWLYLKQKYLSHRLLDDYDALEEAACAAWNRMANEPGRLTSLSSYPWIMNCVNT